jgi:hypothetical protein
MKNENNSQIVLYIDTSGQMKVEMFLYGETAWLTQKRMAEIFDVDIRTISEHFQNIFKTAELNGDSVIRKFRTTAADGKKYETQFYNLDAIISVGYERKGVRMDGGQTLS